MSDDIRCCGTGTCIINAEGFCWCGQRWDGEKMCFPEHNEAGSNSATPSATLPVAARAPSGSSAD
jgi:hypothetical protein